MTHDPEHWEKRLQETEIRLAFFEREANDYKEAVQTLHTRLQQLEKQVASLREGVRGQGQDGAAELGPSDAG